MVEKHEQQIQKQMNNMDKYKELQSAHQELVTHYVDILNTTSALPFFVDIFSIRKVEWDEASKSSISHKLYQLILWPFRFFIRFLTWRPLIALFIEAHFHSKLKELSRSYTRLAQTIDFSKKKNQSKIAWFSEAATNCEKFASTLFSWASIKGSFLGFINIVVGLVLAWVGFDNIFQLAVKFNWSQNITSIIIAFAGILLGSITYGFLVFALVMLSFQGKRVVLFPNVDLREKSHRKVLSTRNIYELENKLFSLIGTKKKPEYPVDLLVTLAITCFIPLFIFLVILSNVISQNANIPLGGVITVFLLLTIFPISSGFQYFSEWKKREWR